MDLWSTNKAALEVGCTADNLRYHVRRGHLSTITVDRGNGRVERLFLRQDIERFIRERDQVHDAAKPSDTAVKVG